MTAPPPVVELERRLSWPAFPTLLFLSFLAMLLALAVASQWLRPSHPEGLPDDPALLATAGLPDRSLGVLAGDLRYVAAALGGAPARQANDAASIERARAAERLLERWTRTHPAEPRVRAALGALALVRNDPAAAARRYREACERAPHYSEGRLGWGVALALEAERTGDPWQRRALTMRAIAQFAAVDPAHPEYSAALYNRARLLAEVDRTPDARALARHFLRLEPDGPWAERLRTGILGPSPGSAR
jgi:tetratricopeptide (TPR) repeat protein